MRIDGRSHSAVSGGSRAVSEREKSKTSAPHSGSQPHVSKDWLSLVLDKLSWFELISDVCILCIFRLVLL